MLIPTRININFGNNSTVCKNQITLNQRAMLKSITDGSPALCNVSFSFFV